MYLFINTIAQRKIKQNDPLEKFIYKESVVNQHVILTK